MCIVRGASWTEAKQARSHLFCASTHPGDMLADTNADLCFWVLLLIDILPAAYAQKGADKATKPPNRMRQQETAH